MRGQLATLIERSGQVMIQIVPDDIGGKGEMAELTPNWRKSSHSIDNGNANCIEVGTAPGTVLVRDTANRAAATQTLSESARTTFTRSVR
jgi:hypothetical protein